MSQNYSESQHRCASQRSCETHCKDADERRESLEYLKLVVRRLYDAQKLRIQSDLRVQRLEREGIVIGERIEHTFTKARELETQTEREYEKIVARELKKFPIWSEWLEKVKGVGPRIAGLMIANIATPARFANVAKLWAYCGLHTEPKCADCDHVISRVPCESQQVHASQNKGEPHTCAASHSTIEPHNSSASRDYSESQTSRARQGETESQEMTASPTQRETQSRSASQFRIEPHKRRASHTLCESHGAHASQPKREAQDQPACPKCGGKNIQNRAARRRTGHKANWSNELKVTSWKAAASFVKSKGSYRVAYEAKKTYLIERQMKRNCIVWKRDTAKNKYVPAFLPTCFHEGNVPKPPTQPEWTIGRIDNMAKRWTAKLFLSHLWAAWRELEGLEVTMPYAIEALGHKDYVSPWMMVDETKIDDVARLLKQRAA